MHIFGKKKHEKNIKSLLTCVMRQCFEALAMGSVTWVQAAPKSINLCGRSCIMSKNALTPTAALHCNKLNKFVP
jgi:hypothetical protein